MRASPGPTSTSRAQGSCDYVAGPAFSFVQNLDAIGAWPPKRDSHVEMDGAWALYEAWLRLQHGDIDEAVVTGSGRSSTVDPELLYPMEMDPNYLAPLGADAMTFAALQARALLDAGLVTERQMAEVAVRSRQDALANPHAQVTGEGDVDALLAERLRPGPAAPPRPAADHRRRLRGDPRHGRPGPRAHRTAGVDPGHRPRLGVPQPGMRDLTASRSTRRRPRRPGLGAGPVEVAELQAPFSHEEVCSCEALDLGDDVRSTRRAAPLATNPVMATGLVRITEAAGHITEGGPPHARPLDVGALPAAEPRDDPGGRQ